MSWPNASSVAWGDFSGPGCEDPIVVAAGPGREPATRVGWTAIEIQVALRGGSGVIFGSPLLTRLVSLFKKMPGVGEKSAQRLALYVMRSDRAETEELARLLIEIKDKVGFCEVCSNVAEEARCVVCKDARRSDDTICVVEQPQDVYVMERTGAFQGRYQVLHGLLSPMDGIGPNELRVGDLVERVRQEVTREVIVATSATLEGDATALYIGQLLGDLRVRVTRLARGLPVGGSIEYLDEATLGRAFEGRAEI